MRPATATGVIILLVLTPLVRAYHRGLIARPLRRWQHAPPPARWPSVSIIIPAWRERGTLEACLSQLRNLDYEDYEAIVVAGGPDGTLETACEHSRLDPHVRVMYQRKSGGKNGAMNDGARRASKEVLVFLDADAFVAPDWLKCLVAALGTDYAASTGRFRPTRRTLVSLAGEMSQVLENEARGRVILQGSGSMAVRRSAFEAVGRIPEGRYADDWALSALLQQAGYRLAYAPCALLYSERPATLREWWGNELRWRRMHLLTLFGVARAELRGPVAAAKALYPYATAWGVVSLSAAAIIGRLTGFKYQGTTEAAWAALVGMALMREVAGAAETAAYTGRAAWIKTAVIVPVLTCCSWVASAIATVTTGKARLHFKGPRQDSVELEPELLVEAGSAPALDPETQVEVAQ
jgi:cellulose synthase/poly-beta-1,6-N-acetylglucosamine synthase-like glycosyltransferase